LLLQVTGGVGVVGLVAVVVARWVWTGNMPEWVGRFGIS